MAVSVRIGHAGAMDCATLYRLLRLRGDVFVVEQACAYADIDGRDLEHNSRQLWAEQDGQVLATLRMLEEPDGSIRIGRVATARIARGSGLAARLMTLALEVAGGSRLVLDAQTYLETFYGRFGFHRTGPEFLEDGIAHVPMERRPVAAA